MILLPSSENCTMEATGTGLPLFVVGSLGFAPRLLWRNLPRFPSFFLDEIQAFSERKFFSQYMLQHLEM